MVDERLIWLIMHWFYWRSFLEDDKMKKRYFIIFALVAFLGFFSMKSVPAGYVGLRSNMLGSGMEEKDYKPGVYLVIPGVHKMNLLESTTQSFSQIHHKMRL